MKSSSGTSQDPDKIGQRFGFGENWFDFARRVDESRIDRAIEGIRRLLDPEILTGSTFLDIGAGA